MLLTLVFLFLIPQQRCTNGICWVPELSKAEIRALIRHNRTERIRRDRLGSPPANKESTFAVRRKWCSGENK
jgi:hypothetical protein